MPDQLADGQARTCTDAVNGPGVVEREPVGRAAPRGQCVAMGAFDLCLFFGGQRVDDCKQGINRALRIGATCCNAQANAGRDAKRQQAGEHLGIGERMAFVDTDVAGKTFGGINPACCRAGMQAIGIIQRPVRLGIARPRQRLGDRNGLRDGRLGQDAGKQLLIIGRHQALDALGVLHQARQSA